MALQTRTLSHGASDVVAAASAPLTVNATVLLLTCPLRRYSWHVHFYCSTPTDTSIVTPTRAAVAILGSTDTYL